MAGLSLGAAAPAVHSASSPSLFGCTHALRSRAQGQRRATQLGVVSEKVLIANTKGGGHAFIGLHLAEQLLQAGHEVTILNDGDEVGQCSEARFVDTLRAVKDFAALLQGKQTKKAPYNQYAILKEKGVQIVWGDPSQPETLPSTDYDVVVDNNGKTLEVCKPLIDAFKVEIYMDFTPEGARNPPAGA